MTAKKIDAQMFLEEQLQDPETAESFYEGIDELLIFHTENKYATRFNPQCSSQR